MILEFSNNFKNFLYFLLRKILNTYDIVMYNLICYLANIFYLKKINLLNN